tara:strand:+ start:1964 stop:2254 length:291 start_codon:yes stop_codon:yes gene_type:complete
MTFNDLKFKEERPELKAVIARHFFPNKWGVSVIKSVSDTNPLQVYSDPEDNTYELAVIVGRSNNDWTIHHDELYPYITEEKVTEIMEQLREREPAL